MRLWCSVDIFFLSLSFKTDTFFIILSFEEIRSSSCPYDARHVSTCFNLSPPPPPSYFSKRIRDSIIEIMTSIDASLCIDILAIDTSIFVSFFSWFVVWFVRCPFAIRTYFLPYSYIYYYHSYTIQLNRIIN